MTRLPVKDGVPYLPKPTEITLKHHFWGEFLRAKSLEDCLGWAG